MSRAKAILLPPELTSFIPDHVNMQSAQCVPERLEGAAQDLGFGGVHLSTYDGPPLSRYPLETKFTLPLIGEYCFYRDPPAELGKRLPTRTDEDGRILALGINTTQVTDRAIRHSRVDWAKHWTDAINQGIIQGFKEAAQEELSGYRRWRFLGRVASSQFVSTEWQL